MAKQYRQRDDFEWNGGLWLPKYGLRGPERKRPTSRRFMPGYPCCCGEEYPCAWCQDYQPNEVEAIISGYNNDCDGACAGLNGTFILQPCKGEGTFYNNCMWYYNFASPISCGGTIYGWLLFPTGGAWFLGIYRTIMSCYTWLAINPLLVGPATNFICQWNNASFVTNPGTTLCGTSGAALVTTL